MARSARTPPSGDRLVTAYRRALRWRTRWRRAGDSVFDGVWMGLLSQEQQRLVNQVFFSVATEPVDGVELQYVDPVHIRSGLFGWERSAASQFRRGGTVVVSSAGAGREVHALGEMGFDVHGFEPNRSLVQAGRRVLADPSRLQLSEWDRFPTFDGRADAVVIGWASYMMVPERALRISLLKDAGAVLHPGGLLLVSYFDRPDGQYYSSARAVGSFVRRLRGRPALELGDSMTPTFAHCFTPAEVSLDLDLAGFDVISVVRTPYAHALARRR